MVFFAAQVSSSVRRPAQPPSITPPSYVVAALQREVYSKVPPQIAEELKQKWPTLRRQIGQVCPTMSYDPAVVEKRQAAISKIVKAFLREHSHLQTGLRLLVKTEKRLNQEHSQRNGSIPSTCCNMGQVYDLLSKAL